MKSPCSMEIVSRRRDNYMKLREHPFTCNVKGTGWVLVFISESKYYFRFVEQRRGIKQFLQKQ